MIPINLQIALRSLAQHKLRSLFLGLAIGGITALLILLNGLMTGIEEMTLRAGSTLMTGHVNLAGFYKPTSGSAIPLVIEYQKAFDAVKEKVPELDHAVARYRGYAKAVSDKSSMDLVVNGLDIETEPDFAKVVQVTEGSLENLRRPNTILVFESQRKRLEFSLGDRMTLVAPTQRGMNNTVDVEIGAIAKDIGILSTWFAYIPNESLRSLYQMKAGSTGAVQLYLKNPDDAERVAARMRSLLGDAGYTVMEADPQAYFIKLMNKVTREDWTGQRLDVTTWKDELSFLGEALGALRMLTFFLILILSVIVVVGIMNTMWIAIRERTREIGTMRAFGMHRRRAGWLFLLEAMMLGLIGSCAGALFSIAATWGINALELGVPEMAAVFLMSEHLHLTVTPGSVLGAILFLTAITSIAALYPALRASKLEPVTAMHHAG